MPEPIKTPAADLQKAPAPSAQPATQVPAQPPVKPAEPTKPASQQPGASQAPATEEKVVPITALHEERQKRQELQAELDALKKVAGQNVLFDINGNPVQYQQQQQPQQQNVRAEIEKAWETDPKRAVQMEIYTAMAWRDQQEAQLDSQEAEFMRTNPDYSNYRAEARQYIRTVPLEQRTNPGLVAMAYYVVRGQKVDSIIAKTKEQLEADYRAKMDTGVLGQGLPAGATGVLPQVPNSVTLTPEQKSACVALGISEADYIKHMAPGGK